MKNSYGLNITKVGKDTILIEPYDSLDPWKSEMLIEHITQEIIDHDIKSAFYDLSKMLIIDEIYYNWLCSLSKTCCVLGVDFKTINMKPTAALSLTSFLKEPASFKTAFKMDIL